MSTSSTTTHAAAQHLIDSRLDAIDRALMGLLSRTDRLAMVAQVEARIRELAPANAAGEANQPGATQPPILDNSPPMDGNREFSPAWQPSWPAAGWAATSRRIPQSRLAISSGVLGIASLALLFALPIVYFVIAYVAPDEFLMVPLLGAPAAAMGGFLAVVFGIVALATLHRRAGRLVGHGWAITGLCTGPLPAFVGCLTALVLGSELRTPTPAIISGVQTASALPPTIFPGTTPYGEAPPNPPGPSYYSATPSLSPTELAPGDSPCPYPAAEQGACPRTYTSSPTTPAAPGSQPPGSPDETSQTPVVAQ